MDKFSFFPHSAGYQNQAAEWEKNENLSSNRDKSEMG